MKQEFKNKLDNCRVELVDIKRRVNRLKPSSSLVRYYTNFALIYASGTLEHIYRSIIADYFYNIHDTKVDKYIFKNVAESSKSVKYTNIIDMLGWFDDKWKKEFQVQVKGDVNRERLIDSSNSLVNNRHNFAHGRLTTVTIGDIVRYFDDVVVLIEYLDSVVK